MTLPFCPQPKPMRGSLVLERDKQKADASALEKREKAIVRRRDPRCRWPEPHECRFGLEAIHIVDASRMGVMHHSNMWRGCGWIHRRGPVSIHGKQIKVECETARGSNGPLSFWKKGEDGEYFLVARETAPFAIEKD